MYDLNCKNFNFKKDSEVCKFYLGISDLKNPAATGLFSCCANSLKFRSYICI
jgi:hypothetical protein